MATCPICGEFRDDTYECRCLADFYKDKKAGRCPAGMIPEAFEYSVWRRIKHLEQALQLHPENEAIIREEFEKLIVDTNEHYKKVQANIAYFEQQKKKLAETPRPSLY